MRKPRKSMSLLPMIFAQAPLKWVKSLLELTSKISQCVRYLTYQIPRHFLLIDNRRPFYSTNRPCFRDQSTRHIASHVGAGLVGGGLRFQRTFGIRSLGLVCGGRWIFRRWMPTQRDFCDCGMERCLAIYHTFGFWFRASLVALKSPCLTLQIATDSHREPSFDSAPEVHRDWLPNLTDRFCIRFPPWGGFRDFGSCQIPHL